MADMINLEERRTGKRRKKRRGYRAFWLVLSLLIVLGGVGYYAVRSFVLTAITVEGNSRYSREEITEKLQLTEGENLLVAWNSARQVPLTEVLPYLATAEVTFSLPDRLIVTVTETTPAGAVAGEGYYLLVDSGYKALEQVQQVPEGMPLIALAGAGETENGRLGFADEKEEEILTLMLESLAKEGMTDRIRQIDLEDRTEITLLYEDRFLVRFGDYGELSEKIRLACEIIRRCEGEKQGVVDVSNPERGSYVAQNLGL